MEEVRLSHGCRNKGCILIPTKRIFATNGNHTKLIDFGIFVQDEEREEAIYSR